MKTSGIRTLLWCSAMIIALTARAALAHPLHSSLASITEQADGEFTVSLRVFADDFLRHTGVPDTTAEIRPESRIVKYLMRTFVIIDSGDRGGRGVPLRWCGSRRAADLLVICLSGQRAGGLRGTRIRYSILTDLFSDQVNILQVSTSSRKQSLLFTPAETTRLIG